MPSEILFFDIQPDEGHDHLPQHESADTQPPVERLPLSTVERGPGGEVFQETLNGVLIHVWPDQHGYCFRCSIYRPGDGHRTIIASGHRRTQQDAILAAQIRAGRRTS